MYLSENYYISLCNRQGQTGNEEQKLKKNRESGDKKKT